MNVFEMLTPFLMAVLGSALGAAFGYFTGLNIYLSTLAGGYGAMLPLIVAVMRTRPKEPRQPPHFEDVRVLFCFILLSIASCAVLPAIAIIFSIKLKHFNKGY
ncbi:hypothetical protein GobsT_54580 [Gemmata obscuriglobus]|uniref:hypothetical protein n=1 Tax=Gemmata obscuriglobus TaxID=114 RepID=UPI0011CCF20B|nr:hypothetical protein [Gemmata obscuriglobus]QEG30652.1 hypothetical protein GobsT_54580 [Gemmata obscuriglobus]VTS09979.1 unnamed protein product [Gemmata obscuriglobus UQM 2246]